MDICCTLVNGNYFIGSASLINSLVTHGFQGEVHVGYTGELPFWWPSNGKEVVPGVKIVSELLQTQRHLGFEKPSFMLAVAQKNPACDRISLFDSDIVITAPWSFLQECFDEGVTVCADVGFSTISAIHPWRKQWRKLIRDSQLEASNNETTVYANGGFAGCQVKDIAFLQHWAKLIDTFEEQGGNIKGYTMAERWKAIVSDQDTLGAALMCWNRPLLVLGQEGMGFNGLSFPMCHGVEAPKAWQISAFKRALAGAEISAYRRFFEHYLQLGPLKPFSKKELAKRKVDLKSAIFLARFYSR
jgi:hypothetical protein